MSTLPQHLSSLDTIHIEDLVVRTVIGIFDHERDRCQDVLINITIWTDIARAAASDSIEDAVNYRELTKKIIHHVSKSQCLLLERLVQEVSDLILDESQIMATRVKIEKPGALRHSRSVGVEILRERS
ncbi:MAG: dihydroneopterin aldolase [Planctomycetes bacterium]|nr:dihydroneopterin aldolase [Planctomycetota bacterium]MBT6453574.1 dihydroneopterin aldolase [Planctomycetota bacterium]MBT6539978.1 dihydroneopterin aldolase [Planctomycetota bacterium]MBT6784406.1 dihydroneopterin aldolase [Planctomycetota bacterium]MBT6968748.1 dihydroneopterin aldolase [Planctomycetota bacterium]